MEINWSLLQPVDLGASFQQGLERGQAMAREGAVRGALRDLTPMLTSGSALGGGDLVEPTDPAYQERKRRAIGVLAMHAPQQFAALESIQRKRTEDLIRQNEARAMATLGQQAVGDPTGAANNALAMGNFELAKQIRALAPDQGKAYETRVKAAAPFAYQARKMQSPQERIAFIQSNADALRAGGWTDQQIASYQGDDATLDNILTGASTLEQLRERDQIRWVTPTEAGSFAINSQGMPVGNANPAAAAVRGQAPAAGPAAGGGIRERNNPGALRVPGSMEFQRFGSEAEGIAAQEAQLGRYQQRGLNTVSKVVETYAPRQSRGGDNTDEQVNNYISYVAGRLGIDPTQPIAPAMVPKLAEAMREFETGDRKPAKSQMASGGAPKRVASKSEFDQLPSGTRFTAPDGSVRVKP